MGKAFTFVSADVIEKIGILEEFRKSDQKDNYETIERMIKYEKENNLINYNEAPSKKVCSLSLLFTLEEMKFISGCLS